MKTTRSTIWKAQGNAHRSAPSTLLSCILTLALLFMGVDAALAADGQKSQAAQSSPRTMLTTGALGAAGDAGGASPTSGAEAPQPSESDPHFTSMA